MSRHTLWKRAQLRTLDAFTTAAYGAWITAPTNDSRKPANNTVRQRLSTLRSFLRWIARQRLDVEDLDELDGYIRQQYPKVYGKRQARNPARFLTYDEAYGQLLNACQDGTWIGSRDQLVIRLGLLGLRDAEIRGLTWGNVHGDVIRTTGKRNRIREVRPGPTLQTMLDRWRHQYARQLDRPLTDDDPIICTNNGRQLTGPSQLAPAAIVWGKPINNGNGIFRIVTKRANLAGLGHVAPHDLRRSAASILHNAKTDAGGHLYDLLDIQKVLDHADPTTTQRSYLDMLDNEVKTRAGRTLD